MAELKITDLVDQSAIDGLKALSAELKSVRKEFEDTAHDLVKGLKVKVEVVGDVEKLQTIIAAGAKKAEEATTRLNSAMAKQNEIVAVTTNTISRELAEIEKENAKKREALQIDQQAHSMAMQTLGTLDQNIRLLAQQKAQMEALKKERKDGNITEAQFLAKERELKIAMQELNGIINNQQKIANSADGSYNNLSLRLELLKKAFKGLTDEEKRSAGGQQMAAEIQNLDAALKDAAADMGEFQRNVGNYAIAGESVKKQLKELVVEAANLTIQWRNMSEAEREAAEGQALIEKLTETKERAGELKDAIGDINQEIGEHASDTKGLDQITAGIELLADGYGVAEGAAHLFGLEEEDLAEVQAKMQAILVVTNGLTKIQNALQEQSAVMLGIKTIQQKAASAAEAMATKNTMAATVAQKAFNLVAKANPYVLLATAVLTVVGALAAFSIGSKKASESEERLNSAMGEAYKDYAKARIEVDAYKQKLDKFNGTKEQEKALVDELNGKYGEALGKYSSLSEWKKVLAERGNKLAESILYEAKAQAILNEYVEAYGKKRELEQKQKDFEQKGFWGKFWDNLRHLRTGDKNGYADDITDITTQLNNLENEYKEASVAAQQFKATNNIGGHNRPSTTTGSKNTTTDKSDLVADEIARRKLINDAALSVEEEGTLKWLELKKESNKIAYDEDLHNTKLTGEKRAEYERLLQERLRLQNEEAIDAMKHYMEEREKEVTDALEEERLKRLDEEEKYFAARQVADDQSYQEQIASLKKAYAEGIITEEEFNARSEKLTDEYAKHKANDAIKYLQKILASEELTTEERQKLQERLKQAQIDAENAVADAAIHANKRKEESDKQRLENAQTYLQKAGEVISEINNLTQAVFDRKVAKVEEEEEMLNEQYDADKQRIQDLNDAGVISKEEADQRMAALDESKAAKEAELQEKMNKIKEKQAKVDKANSIVQAAISTALGIMQVYAQPGNGGFISRTAMAATLAAIGAIQIATIAAQPLPKYARGTDSHKGGPAIVGDGGRAEIISYNGHAFLTPDHPTIVTMPRGAKVFPDAQEMVGLVPIPMYDERSVGTGVVVNPTNVRGIESRTDETNRLLKQQMRQQSRLAYEVRYQNYKSSRV